MERRRNQRAPALLDALLDGRSAPGLVARTAAGLGLPEQGRYAVAVLREDGSGHGVAAEVADASGMRLVWRRRKDRALAVVALGDRSPAQLCALLRARCAGPGGISPVADGLAGIGRARRLAETALLAGATSAGIVRLEERLPAALVVSRPELAALLITEVFAPLLVLEPADRALLLRTLDAWLDCGGSAGRAAALLYCHRNTVFNRLRRLERLSARSLSRPADLIELMLAREALRLTPPPP